MRTWTSIILRAIAVVAVSVATALPSRAPASDRMERRAQVSSLLMQSREHLLAGKYDSALVTLQEIEGIDPSNQDASYFTALVHLARADTSRAIDVLSTGMARAPLSSRLKLLRVRLHLDFGELSQADSLLNIVLSTKPNHAESMYLSGLVGLARGDTSYTLEVWEGVLARIHQGFRTDKQ